MKLFSHERVLSWVRQIVILISFTMVLHQFNLISLKLMLYKREKNMAHIFCMVINCTQLKKVEFLLWEEIHTNVFC